MTPHPQPEHRRTGRFRRALGITVPILMVGAGLTAALAQSAYAAGTYDPNDAVKPIIAYDFNGDSGTTVVDSSGNGNDATWITGPSGDGAPTPTYADGVSGGAAHIDSGDSVIQLPLLAGETDASGSFSYEFWLKLNAATADGPIFSNQDFAHCYNPGTTLYNTDNTQGILRACFGQNGTSNTKYYVPNVSSDSVMDQWHHIAVVADRDAETLTTYVDAVQTAQSTALTSTMNLNSGLPFLLGTGGANAYTDGLVDADIDDLNFFDQAITGEQIAADARRTYDPNDAVRPIIAYDFNGDSGTTVVDSSGNGNDSTWITGPNGDGTPTPTYADGVSGGAAHIDNGDSVIQLPLLAGETDASGSFSYEFWLKLNAATKEGAIFSNQDFAHCYNPGTSLYNTNNTQGILRACFGKNGTSNTKYYVPNVSSDSVMDQWHHIAVVADRDAETMTTYVDAVQTAQSTALTSTMNLNSGLPFLIGAGGANEYKDGLVDADIDDLNFFDQAITGEQIAADYVATEPTAGPPYTVAFDGNGATSGSTASVTMNAGVPGALPSNGFTRTDYQFGGWATDPGGPIAYADGQSVTDLTTTANATVTLYAIWNRFRASGDTVAPIISYDFDSDTGSTVVDSSGSGFDGAWSGTPAYDEGLTGKAAFVDSPPGSDRGMNFMTLPLIDGRTDASSSFSYVFWLKEMAVTEDSPIVSNQNFRHCYNPGTTLYNTAGSPGILRACFGQNGSSTSQNYLPGISSTSVIGDWHQVAVVVDRDAGTMTTYLDGQHAVQSYSLSSGFNLNSGYAFHIGAEAAELDGDGFITAYIDNFDFYDKPIDAQQVHNDYVAAIPPVPVTNEGATVQKGFVTDTFRAPQVRTGDAVVQPVAALWNGEEVTSYTKVSGAVWLSVGDDGVVTGTAPDSPLANPATITVEATDGVTTSQITVEVRVLGAGEKTQLQAATWNLWDAGSHVSDATLKNLAVIASNGLDLIGVQEDGGSMAAALANALGWYSYEGPGGAGIISAYPLVADSAANAPQSAPAAGVSANVLGSDVRVWSVGLDDESYGPEAACLDGVSDPATLVANEKTTTRYASATAIADGLSDDIAGADDTPVIVLGDLESPSAADWKSANSSSHCDIGAVKWPVPEAFLDAGLTDSFRAAHSSPTSVPGNTWSPVTPTNAETGQPEPQDRIDYVLYAGEPLGLLGSNTLVAGWPSVTKVVTQAWASDHRAVVTTFLVDASSDDGSGDNGSGDDGSGDDGSGDDGSGDNGSGDNGSGDNGSGDNGSGDNGSGDNGSGDNGSGDNGSGAGSDNGTHTGTQGPSSDSTGKTSADADNLAGTGSDLEMPLGLVIALLLSGAAIGIIRVVSRRRSLR